MGASLLKTKLLLLCLLLLPSSPLRAREKTDVVVMRNGDRLICEIKSLENTGRASLSLTGGFAWQQINYQQNVGTAPSQQLPLRWSPPN